VDEVMDMARTTVNLVGNCLATAVVGRWEGELIVAGEGRPLPEPPTKGPVAIKAAEETVA